MRWIVLAALTTTLLTPLKAAGHEQDGLIMFTQHSSRDPERIFIANADGTHVRTIAGPYCVSQAWSRDGTRIAFSCLRGPGARQWGDMIMNSDGSKKRVITHEFGGTAFSPDGRRIALANSSGIKLISLDGSSRIVVPGTARAQLGHDPFEVDWSPDGRHLAFTTSDGVLYVVNLDGTQLKRLCGDVDAPRWAPDSRSILVISSASRAWRVALGGKRTLIPTANGDRFGMADWSADGRRIVYLSMRDRSLHFVSVGSGTEQIRRLYPDVCAGWYCGWEIQWQHRPAR